MSIRVIIVDDHRIFREGLRKLLEMQPDIRVIGEAEDGETALKLVQKMLPSVVIMDILLPNLNGIETTRQIIARAPGTKVVALSMYSARRFIIGMLSAGASAYLPKDCGFEELGKAIRAVAEGKTYLSSTIVDTVVRDYFNGLQTTDYSALDTLTSRE